VAPHYDGTALLGISIASAIDVAVEMLREFEIAGARAADEV
jgi:hypothetical protein